jgi:hypothetical protein
MPRDGRSRQSNLGMSAAARDGELVPLPGPIPRRGGGKDQSAGLRAAKLRCASDHDRVDSMTGRIDLIWPISRGPAGIIFIDQFGAGVRPAKRRRGRIGDAGGSSFRRCRRPLEGTGLPQAVSVAALSYPAMSNVGSGNPDRPACWGLNPVRCSAGVAARHITGTPSSFLATASGSSACMGGCGVLPVG